MTKLNERNNNEEFILIWPQFSGYREDETKEVKIITYYAPIYTQIVDNSERFENISINDFQVALPASELEAISIFDPDVFELFENASES